MTSGDIAFIVEAELQQVNVNITLDRPTILICENEALQILYPIMLMTDDSLWTSSASFGSSGTVNHPSNYRLTRAVEITGAAIGGARKVGHREFQTVSNNTSIGPTDDDPIFRVDAGSLQIAPGTAGAGVHYYIRTIPEITTYTQDLFAFGTSPPMQCMWAFREALILLTAHLMTLREAMQPNLEGDEVARMFDVAERFKREYDKAKRPLALFNTNQQTPTIAPEMLEQKEA